jgi:hypothetical protein
MQRFFGFVLVSMAVLLVLPVASADVDERLASAFREAAREYKAWGRVDDEVRFAPWLCRLPMRSRARVSEAGPHARKVYFLYSSDRAAYVSLGHPEARRHVRPGFTIVKESFHAAEHAPGDRRGEVEIAHGDPYRLLQDGERWVGAGAPHGLYIMKYVGRRRGTDAGWVYGTIDAQGEVTGAGRISSCMGCHQDAPHGRLFGLQGRAGI